MDVATCWVDGVGLPKVHVCSSVRYREGVGGVGGVGGGVLTFMFISVTHDIFWGGGGWGGEC